MTACRICGGEAARTHRVPECMFRTGEAFDYEECGACGGLQITTIPEDLDEHYPPEYYSRQPASAEPGRRGWRSRLERRWLRHESGERDLVGRLLARRWRSPPPFVRWWRATGARFGDRILDVGCGSGRLMRFLAWIGYRDLTGIDPHAPSHSEDGGVRIRRRRIEDHDGAYDLVLFHSSLEHVEDPVAALRGARRLLSPDGRVCVRIPVAGSEAWERYGVHWVQLDAPRHLHLLTPKGMEIAASRVGLRVDRTVFDSSAFQFWGSEQARKGLALMAETSHAIAPDRSAFTAEEVEAWTAEAARLNEAGRGDTAAFILRGSREVMPGTSG